MTFLYVIIHKAIKNITNENNTLKKTYRYCKCQNCKIFGSDLNSMRRTADNSQYIFTHKLTLHTQNLTRYLSEDTLTSMKSSPTLTFSPSDLCLLAGCIVHQQVSPCACAVRPTSNANLSLDEDVVRHDKYWMTKE